jgi:hypothetical protein
MAFFANAFSWVSDLRAEKSKYSNCDYSCLFNHYDRVKAIIQERTERELEPSQYWKEDIEAFQLESKIRANKSFKDEFYALNVWSECEVIGEILLTYANAYTKKDNSKYLQDVQEKYDEYIKFLNTKTKKYFESRKETWKSYPPEQLSKLNQAINGKREKLQATQNLPKLEWLEYLQDLALASAASSGEAAIKPHLEENETEVKKNEESQSNKKEEKFKKTNSVPPKNNHVSPVVAIKDSPVETKAAVILVKEKSKFFYWKLSGGIIGGLLILTGLSHFMFFKRRLTWINITFGCLGSFLVLVAIILQIFM